MKPRGDIKDEAYTEFYRFLTNDIDEPASRLHLTSDAPLSFKSVLFLPKTNLEKLGMGKLEHGPDLYAQKVLIQHNCKELVPDYLRFVRGVVDSEDIALNVSRETIQDNIILRKISSHIVRKLLEDMAGMLEGKREDYEKFYGEFGRILKEGIGSDYENRERLATLLLFNSSAMDSEADLTSLKEYAGRMREGQESIYYLTGPDRAALEVSPHLEMFRKNGIEVLYLYDPVDDFVLAHLREFDKKPLKSADQVSPEEIEKAAGPEGKADVEEKADTLAFKSDLDALIKRFKEVLGDRVLDVKESARLATSPCILVSPEGGPSIQLQKVMSMMDKNFHMAKRVLEINKDNALIRNLAKINRESPDSPLIPDCCEQLLESAMLMEGIMPDPAKMVPRIHKIMEEASRRD